MRINVISNKYFILEHQKEFLKEIIIIKVKAKNYMFQAIKINNYENLLATKNNRKVTFIINQFQVSICSSTFSPCINPDKTLRIVLSLSINIVFCISPTICFATSFMFKTFYNSTIALFIPPPNAPIINGITVILYPGLLSLNSYANCVS